MSKCPVCKSRSCGDDFHTITKYKGPEKRAGDRMKIILLQVNDLMDEDNFQVSEIKALINNLIDEHVEEYEDG